MCRGWGGGAGEPGECQGGMGSEDSLEGREPSEGLERGGPQLWQRP